jgi:hypothetical protein
MTNADKFINSLKKKKHINSNDFFEMIRLSNNKISRSKIENAINSSNSLREAYKDFLNEELKNISNLNKSNRYKKSNNSSNNTFNYSNNSFNNNNFKFNRNNNINTSYEGSVLEEQISNLSTSATNNRKKTPKRKTINKSTTSKKRKSKNKSTNKSTTSKKRKVHTGPRGGKYIVANGRNKYV